MICCGDNYKDKKLLGAPGRTTRNKKLLGTRTLDLLWGRTCTNPEPNNVALLPK